MSAPGGGSDPDFRSYVRAFLEKHASTAGLRRSLAAEPGYDVHLWRRAALELGLQGLGVPETHGGAGASFADLAVAFEELGRAVTSMPFLASIGLAAQALLLADDEEAQGRWLPGLVTGDLVATVALGRRAVDDVSAPDFSARSVRGAWKVDGRAHLVLHGGEADVVLVVADTHEGPTLFGVDAAAPEVTRTGQESLDLTRPMAVIDLAGAPAAAVGGLGSGLIILDRVLARARVLLAAEQVGGAAAALESATAYAKHRHQFGRAIGSFQAIKHMLARVYAENAAAEAAARWAANGHDDRAEALAVRVASAFSSEAYFAAASANIQVHGGIGFTWENDAHLFFRRATWSKEFLGSPSLHYETIATSRLGHIADPVGAVRLGRNTAHG